MITDLPGMLCRYARQGLLVAVVVTLAGCGAPASTEPILARAPSSGMIAVSTKGSHDLRFLYVRGDSIVLMRTVFLPDDQRIESVAWSADGRSATIETSAGRVALDTRSWRLAARTGMAGAPADDTFADGAR
jgi:hypothetical protein